MKRIAGLATVLVAFLAAGAALFLVAPAKTGDRDWSEEPRPAESPGIPGPEEVDAPDEVVPLDVQPARVDRYGDLGAPVRFDLVVATEDLRVLDGKLEWWGQQTFLGASELEATPSAGRASLRVLSLRRKDPVEGMPPGIDFPDTVPGHSLEFSLTAAGEMSEFALEPEAGLPPRSFVRALVRLHVPAILVGRSGSDWRWKMAALDIVGGVIIPEWPAVPNPTHPLGVDPHVMVSRWAVLRDPAGAKAEEGDGWPVLDIEHFDPFPLDDPEVSRLYRASFLVAPDGYPLAGDIRCARKSNIDQDYWGYDIRAWILREGFVMGEAVKAAFLARGEATSARLLEGLPPPGTKSPLTTFEELLADPEVLAPKLPIELRTDTVADLECVLQAVVDRKSEAEYREVLWHLAAVAAKDPMIRDRLLQIAEGGESLELRQAALFVLGMTELPEVRARLLDFVESEDFPPALRQTALQAVFISRQEGVGESEGRLVSGFDPIHDSAALARVLRFSEREEIPTELEERLVLAVGTGQLAYGEGQENPLSRRLRDIYETRKMPGHGETILRQIGSFPSEENFRFLAGAYKADEDGKLRRWALSSMEAGLVKDARLARSLNGVLFDLGESGMGRPDRALIVQRVNYRNLDGERWLALVRGVLFDPPRPDECGFRKFRPHPFRKFLPVGEGTFVFG